MSEDVSGRGDRFLITGMWAVEFHAPDGAKQTLTADIGGVPAALLFTDEDLARRGLSAGPPSPAGYTPCLIACLTLDQCFAYLERLRRRGYTHVAFDNAKTAHLSTIDQVVEAFQRTQRNEGKHEDEE
jgi:hypothetical protein